MAGYFKRNFVSWFQTGTVDWTNIILHTQHDKRPKIMNGGEVSIIWIVKDYGDADAALNSVHYTLKAELKRTRNHLSFCI